MNLGTTVIERPEIPPAAASGAPPVAAQVLLVDDEPKLRDAIAEGLRIEGWNVICAESGAEALRRMESVHFDLVVLDWMLPDVDGMELLRRVREQDRQVPVLMVTARNTHADQAMAFANGATDYLTKPFAFADLLTRCRSLLVPVPPQDGRIVHREIELDLTTRTLRWQGARISLTEIEVALLAFLLRNAHDIASTDTLSRQVWKDHALSVALHSAIEIQMKMLMEKIATWSGLALIQIVPGIGYTIEGTALRAMSAGR
jgi:DNA-binding response OmpR family regulator